MNMSVNRKQLQAWCLLCVGLLVIGCGPTRPKDMPPVFPCSVTVVNRGTPVQGASVFLVTDEGLARLSANGKTDSNGVALVKTTRMGTAYAASGAPAGRYSVSVEKRPPWADAKPDEQVRAMTPDESKAYWEKFDKAMETLPREVPKSLSRNKKQPLEVVDGKGGQLTIDVAGFTDE